MTNGDDLSTNQSQGFGPLQLSKLPTVGGSKASRLRSIVIIFNGDGIFKIVAAHQSLGTDGTRKFNLIVGDIN